MNEINVVQLSANFEKIAQLEDPVEEMYELIKYASNQDVNEVHVIKLYEAYCVKKNTPDILSAQIKGTIYLFEKYCKYVLNVISHFSIFLILKSLGSLLIVGAIISFFISIPRKNIELKFKEIETVENSMGTEYSSARIQAMELLNKKCAKLKGINLDTANLDYVNFTQCRGLIPFSNHQGFDLTGANLNNAHLNGADLKKIVLSNAKIDCTEFKGANLSNANLSNSLIRHSDLTFANLSGADLTGTDFTGSNLYGVNLREAILDGAIFTDVDLMHADLSKVRSHRSDYTGANLSGARLNGADFHLSEFSKTRVKNIYVDKNTSFDGACINPESCKHYEDNTLRTEATKECEPRSEDRGSDEFEVRHPMLIDLLTSDQNNSLKWFGDRSFVPYKKSDAPQRDVYSKGIKIGLIFTDRGEFFMGVCKGIVGAIDTLREVKGWKIELYAITIASKDTVQKVGKCEKYFNNLRSVKDTISPEDKLNREREVLEALQEKEVQAIAMIPQDEIDSKKAISEATANGILVGCYDHCVNESDAQYLVITNYKSDQAELGKSTGEAVVDWYHDQTEIKELKVGVIKACDSDGCYKRVAGFRKALNDAQISWTEVAYRTRAFNVDTKELACELLRDHPDVNILWSTNEDGTKGALECLSDDGIKNENRSNIKVFGTDWNEDFAEHFNTGRLMGVTMQSPESMGDKFVTQAMAILGGEQINYDQTTTPNIRCTKDNYKKNCVSP